MKVILRARDRTHKRHLQLYVQCEGHYILRARDRTHKRHLQLYVQCEGHYTSRRGIRYGSTRQFIVPPVRLEPGTSWLLAAPLSIALQTRPRTRIRGFGLFQERSWSTISKAFFFSFDVLNSYVSSAFLVHLISPSFLSVEQTIRAAGSHSDYDITRMFVLWQSATNRPYFWCVERIALAASLCYNQIQHSHLGVSMFKNLPQYIWSICFSHFAKIAHGAILTIMILRFL